MSLAVTPTGRAQRTGDFLEEVFHRYHRPSFIEPDPLQFLRDYPKVMDREIAAVIAAGLAYGTVSGIVRSVKKVLDDLGPEPSRSIRRRTSTGWRALQRGFVHRWTTGEELVALLKIIGRAQDAWGGLGVHLSAVHQSFDEDLQAAWVRWMRDLKALGWPERQSLLPDPSRPSACKRLYLLARWMVRCDAVDPGGWTGLSASQLLVPLDVHMHRMGRLLGFTRRRSADLRTTREITAGFRRYAPEDPARYDFSLTRLPLHERITPTVIREVWRSGFAGTKSKKSSRLA